MAYEGPHPFPISSGGTGLISTDSVVQIQKTTLSTWTSTTGAGSVIPFDNVNPPENTEGAPLFLLSITPTNASNVLYISFEVFASTNTGLAIMAFTLFQDSNQFASYVQSYRNMGSGAITSLFPVSGYYSKTAGTTSLTAFSLRFGSNNSSNTVGINGNDSAVFFGGVPQSSLMIMEVKP